MPTPSNLQKQQIIPVRGYHTIKKPTLFWNSAIKLWVNSTFAGKGEIQSRNSKLPMPLLASVKNLLHWAWWEWWTEERGWLNSSQTGWNSPWSNSSAFKWQEKKNQQKYNEIGQNITLDISNISSYFIYNTVIVYYWTCEAMWFDVGALLSKCLR